MLIVPVTQLINAIQLHMFPIPRDLFPWLSFFFFLSLFAHLDASVLDTVSSVYYFLILSFIFIFLNTFLLIPFFLLTDEPIRAKESKLKLAFIERLTEKEHFDIPSKVKPGICINQNSIFFHNLNFAFVLYMSACCSSRLVQFVLSISLTFANVQFCVNCVKKTLKNIYIKNYAPPTWCQIC